MSIKTLKSLVKSSSVAPLVSDPWYEVRETLNSIQTQTGNVAGMTYTINSSALPSSSYSAQNFIQTGT